MKKLTSSLLLAGLIAAMVVGMVLAQGISGISGVTWTGSGGVYRYTMNADLTGGYTAVCVQYKTQDADGVPNQWSYHQKLCADTGSGSWTCEIPHTENMNWGAGYNYEFYLIKSSSPSDAACADFANNQSDWWTNEAWQSTGPTAVTLTSLAGSAPVVVLLVAGAVLSGAVIITRRRRR